MATLYEFVMRFRNEQEPEGYGSMLYRFATTYPLLNCTVQQVQNDILRRHPSIQFDGMTLCACVDS